MEAEVVFVLILNLAFSGFVLTEENSGKSNWDKN